MAWRSSGLRRRIWRYVSQRSDGGPGRRGCRRRSSSTRATTGDIAGLLKRVRPLYPWLRAVFADSIYNRLTALLACFLFGLTLIPHFSPPSARRVSRAVICEPVQHLTEPGEHSPGARTTTVCLSAPERGLLVNA
jgi:hypothetical protein